MIDTMVKSKAFLALFILFITIISCNDNSTFNPVKEVASAVQNIMSKTSSPKLIQEKKIGDFIYTASFRPAELISKYEEESGVASKSNPGELNQSLYFQLDIEHETFADELLKFNISGYQQYDKRIKYCSFNMIGDVSIITGKDTIPCGLHHFERSFNIGSKTTFLLAFPVSAKSISEDVTLLYHDNLFENGIVKFYFRKELFNPDKYKS